jgi:hypothetical protein
MCESVGASRCGGRTTVHTSPANPATVQLCNSDDGPLEGCPKRGYCANAAPLRASCGFTGGSERGASQELGGCLMGLGDFVPDGVEDWAEDRVEDVGEGIDAASDWGADRLDDVGWESGADWGRSMN